MISPNADPAFAATVLLAREAEPGIEIYMQKRPGRGAFPDLHVFPGGKLDAQDIDFARARFDQHWHDLANSTLGVEADGLAFWITVIRECFEEAGVLLANDPAGRLVSFPAADAEPLRESMVSGELSIAELCDRFKLTLALDHLHYLSHWITPEVAPRRFNTRFFVARMPDRQSTLRHRGETRTGEWIRPVDALANAERGDWQMIAPTLTSLRSIEGCGSLADLVERVGSGEHRLADSDALRVEGLQPWPA